MNITNNLTFAILTTSSGWKTDFTVRQSEYYSHKINGKNYSDYIVFPFDVDAAIAECKTDYLLIQESGHVTANHSFFETLENSILEKEDIFLGHLVAENDYLVLDTRCLFINIPMWKEAGSPAFRSQVRQGPPCKIVAMNNEGRRITQVVVDGDVDVFITGECSQQGAALIVKQLELFKQATSLEITVDAKQSYFLNATSPYQEIHTETFFEKNFLYPSFKNVFCGDTDDYSDVRNSTADIVIAPASGLKASSLADHFKASRVIVYDINPDALELQRAIFGITKAAPYADILAEFKKNNPHIKIVDAIGDDKFSVVFPTTAQVEFRLIDAFSYELEDLVKSVNQTQTLVFDFSDLFISPNNYYKRPLYQVQGLYNEVYSLLGSRQGPTFILGNAPQFKNMNTVEVNTSTVQYKMDPTYVKPNLEDEELELTQEIIDKMEEQEALASQMYKPLVLDAPQDDTKVWQAPLPTEEMKVPDGEIVFVAPSEPLPVVIVEEVKPPAVEVVVAPPIVLEDDFSDFAMSLGYAVTATSVAQKVLSKTAEFPGLSIVYLYKVNTGTHSWSFNVKKVDGLKEVEFSTGLDIASLRKHLEIDVKINHRTVARYL